MVVRKKIFISVGVVALLAAGVLLTAILYKSDRRASGLTLYGNVDIRQVDLGFRVGGRIREAR